VTKRATATKAQIRRNIKAALTEGLRITGITTRPDGTVTVETAPLHPSVDHGLQPLEEGRVVVL
jgi:hypothetical protein